MKNLKIISLLCAVLLFSAIIFAANDKNEAPPPWMEDIKVKGRSTYLVPKGAKRKIIGSQVVVEPPNEYVARRLYEIEQDLEERFTKIEKNQEELKKELEEIRNALNEVKKEQKGKQNPVSQ